jgi:hypothetical protein
MAAINRAWRENQLVEMRPYLHANVTMVLPKFSGTIVGADALVASFIEFCKNARVLEYKETHEEIQIVDDIAFVSYRFNMLYERSSYRERSLGQDIWVFHYTNGKWLAIWRTMVNLEAIREPES